MPARITWKLFLKMNIMNQFILYALQLRVRRNMKHVVNRISHSGHGMLGNWLCA